MRSDVSPSEDGYERKIVLFIRPAPWRLMRRPTLLRPDDVRYRRRAVLRRDRLRRRLAALIDSLGPTCRTDHFCRQIHEGGVALLGLYPPNAENSARDKAATPRKDR